MKQFPVDKISHHILEPSLVSQIRKQSDTSSRNCRRPLPHASRRQFGAFGGSEGQGLGGTSVSNQAFENSSINQNPAWHYSTPDPTHPNTTVHALTPTKHQTYNSSLSREGSPPPNSTFMETIPCPRVKDAPHLNGIKE